MPSFKQTKDGRSVENFVLKNAAGMEVEISSYGGIITRLLVPDRDGKLDDIVLGFSSLAEYEADTSFHGALIGRYGNRIAKGQFSLGERIIPCPSTALQMTSSAIFTAALTGFIKSLAGGSL